MQILSKVSKKAIIVEDVGENRETETVVRYEIPQDSKISLLKEWVWLKYCPKSCRKPFLWWKLAEMGWQKMWSDTRFSMIPRIYTCSRRRNIILDYYCPVLIELPLLHKIQRSPRDLSIHQSPAIRCTRRITTSTYKISCQQGWTGFLQDVCFIQNPIEEHNTQQSCLRKMLAVQDEKGKGGFFFCLWCSWECEKPQQQWTVSQRHAPNTQLQSNKSRYQDEPDNF